MNEVEVPLVSLLIAMRNEQRFIGDTLTSVFGQDYPQSRIEVIIADGNSTDDSRSIVGRLIADRPGCHLIDNPGMIQSCGWNLGIEKCRGDIIGIVSAHCELAPDYIRQAVDTLQRTGADLVGGPMVAISREPVGRSIAAATSSPFGVGGARFHYTQSEEEVDTVYQGLCWRNLYERIGGFDPEMIRNQDDELSFRIRAAGGRIVCNPGIRSSYHNRSTFRSLSRQYFQYGFWKVRLMQKCLKQMQARHFAPGIFVLAFFGLLILGMFLPLALGMWLLLVGVYALAAATAAFALARRGNGSAHVRVLAVFPILHFSYGAGFLKGLLYWPRQGPPGRAPVLKIADIGPKDGSDCL